MIRTCRLGRNLVQVKWAWTGWQVTSYYGSKRWSIFQLYRETSIDEYPTWGLIVGPLCLIYARI